MMKKVFLTVVALVVYTDGGLDHNINHTSVRLYRLSIFVELGMDTIVLMGAAPEQNWGKPVERVMVLLNLVLQDISLARDEF
jgi:hypothetical protein